MRESDQNRNWTAVRQKNVGKKQYILETTIYRLNPENGEKNTQPGYTNLAAQIRYNIHRWITLYHLKFLPNTEVA
jgi:hypothetical protein